MKRVSLRLLLLLFLTLPVWAAPRIALVQPLDGAEATLAGHPLTKPELAREGDHLIVTTGSVRVQLLNSGRELTLESGHSLTLTKASIGRLAEQVDRGEIVIERGLGSVSWAAAAKGRPGYAPIGVQVSPPTMVEGEWVYRVECTEDPKNVTVYILDANQAAYPEDDKLDKFTITSGVNYHPCKPEAREPGRDYLIETHIYTTMAVSRPYRVLLAEEEEALQMVARSWREELDTLTETRRTVPVTSAAGKAGRATFGN